MKKLFLGAALGAAAVYVFCKYQKEGGMQCMYDDVKCATAKVKKGIKDTFHKGKNEVEYLGEQAENVAKKGQDKLHGMMS